MLIKRLAIGMLGLCCLVLVVESISLSKYLANSNITALESFYLFCLRLPEIIFRTSPFLVAFSVIMLFAHLKKSNQIKAMILSGASYIKLITPILLVAIVFSISIWFFNQYISPITNQKLDNIKIGKLKMFTRKWTDFHRQGKWFMHKNILYGIGSRKPAGNSILAMNIFELDHNFLPRTRILAKKADYTPGGWVLEGVEKWDFNLEKGLRLSSFKTVRECFPFLKVHYDFFQDNNGYPSEMNFQQLNRLIKARKSQGQTILPYLIELYQKALVPINGVFLSIIAAMLSLIFLQRANPIFNILMATSLSLFHWVLTSTCNKLAVGQVISPIMATIIPFLLISAVTWGIAKKAGQR